MLVHNETKIRTGPVAMPLSGSAAPMAGKFVRKFWIFDASLEDMDMLMLVDPGSLSGHRR